MMKNGTFIKMSLPPQLWKHKNAQNDEMQNDENGNHDQNSPSATPPLDFGLKTGSRGTPWNSKSAGPGGSDFTKCQFWPFIWHFGLFQGGSIFDTFLSLFQFYILLIFSLFDFLVFVTFSLFLIFSILHFFCFVDFWSFLLIFSWWHHFWSFFVTNLSAPIMTHFLSSKPALPLSPILVVKFDLILDH